MPEKQYFEGIDVKLGSTVITSVDVKDSEARSDLADLEDYVEEIAPVSLSVTENGTYTAPTGVFGYSPVTVNVTPPVELISRSDWNALTTAQKQAKGLVAIQDASTGFNRGALVNGADYIPANIYIPYSDETKVLTESYVDNFDATATSWGIGSNPAIYVDNAKKPSIDTTENAVSVDATQGVCTYVDMGLASTPFTAYCVLKAISPAQYTRLMCSMDAMTVNQGIILIGNNIYISSYKSDTATGVFSSSYFVGCIKYGANDTAGYVYDAANDNLIKVTKIPSTVGRDIVLGRMKKSDTSDQGNLMVKYFAVVGETESDSVIENNIMNLYNEFLAE